MADKQKLLFHSVSAHGDIEWETFLTLVHLHGRIQDFSKGSDFCKGGGGGGVTIHFLITKICELGACFLYIFIYVGSK